MKVMCQALTETLSYQNVPVVKSKVLVMAPTGVAAVNMEGTTLHSALNIPIGYFGQNLPPLTDK